MLDHSSIVLKEIISYSMSKFKSIAVNETNFQALKNLGKAGDSMNDVVTELLKKAGVTV